MKQSLWSNYLFSPVEHENDLLEIIKEVETLSDPGANAVNRILRKYPKNGNSIFSRSELIAGYRYFANKYHWESERNRIVEILRMKPVRSLSGVTPVTILTKPFPCPGQCIFCPNDVKMPKSYLSREPGAQRAGKHQFDPYEQTFSRLEALYRIGHPVDKVELIVLGGTWSSYPEPYQIWFLKRAFDALNEFEGNTLETCELTPSFIQYDQIAESVIGRSGENNYNQIVSDFVKKQDEKGVVAARESATWAELHQVQAVNEKASSRCVGLSLETRPDHVTENEAIRLRSLGATKIQIGYQSLSDEILLVNQRGHDVKASRSATKILRRAGFKIQAHWMANLYGSTPKQDVEDYKRLFSDEDFRPDELKIYPCNLVETAELMKHYASGCYRPYTEAELLSILIACLKRTPSYCRVSRVIRDIPGDDILAGSRVTNFRAIAEEEMSKQGIVVSDIRSREIKGRVAPADKLELSVERYRTSVGEEVFLQFVTKDKHLAGFLRLCLPIEKQTFIDELSGSGIIREVHVYGTALSIGCHDESKVQHAGLGRRLLAQAAVIARMEGFDSLAVISSVGTREYYRRQGFRDGTLYQHKNINKNTFGGSL